MAGHGHSHGGGCDGDHDHDNTPEMGVQYSLFTKIDLENLECLNEAVENSGKDVFKPWEERLNVEKVSLHSVCKSRPSLVWSLFDLRSSPPPHCATSSF